MMRFIIANFIVLIVLISACRKDERITSDPNAKLSFSEENILFDTIFTTVGSTTKKLKIINKNGSAINISEISLAGGNSSAFSININGVPAINRKNILLNGRDSLNIFVKASINPNASNSPFLVQDSIILSVNGNKQAIGLTAYGKNAVFINDGIIAKNTDWTKNLPYVINGSLTIASQATLQITAGAKIYFHKDAVLNVEGNLIVQGAANNRVEFSSDRLENLYSEEPGQWQGIYIKRWGNAIIDNALIKNASVGITADSLSSTAKPKLIVANSIIKNMQVAAYIGYHSEINAFNNLMYNCGNYLIYGVGGGIYNLKQNTFAGFNPSFPRKNAAITLSDYYTNAVSNSLQVNLTNNIIWGSLSNELDVVKKTNAISQIIVKNNLIKTTNPTYSNNNIVNADPLFIYQLGGNYQLAANSVANGKGESLINDNYFNTYLRKDLLGNDRVFPSTLGCYEKK